MYRNLYSQSYNVYNGKCTISLLGGTLNQMTDDRNAGDDEEDENDEDDNNDEDDDMDDRNVPL